MTALPPLPTGTIRTIDPDWSTPLTGISAHHGGARLKPTSYEPGYYRLEGIGGHEFYQTRSRMPVNQLQRREAKNRWKTWMIDDPLHWYGMRERVLDLPPGRLLVAGLGLGLFAHHIAAERPDITEVTIVEIDPDVIALMAPTLPDLPNLTVVEADYYMHIAHIAREGQPRPDAVLWDLAVGGVDATRGDFYRALAETTVQLPGTVLSCFGLRDGKRTILG